MPVEASGVITALSNFGALGVLVAFLMWRDVRAETEKFKADQSRLAYDKDRLECDKALLATLEALKVAIQMIAGGR